jgi:4-oxalocrotonate tautomerase
MPTIEIHLLEGRSDEMKEKLIYNMTKAVHDTLHVPVTNIRVILDEMKLQNFGVGGESEAARQAREGGT